MTNAAALFALSLVVAQATPAPKPGALKTFRDWTVGCDNGGTCAMASLGPEAGDVPTVTASLIRAGGPDGGWTVEVGGEDAVDGVAIDGVRIGTGARLTGAAAAALVAAMANGRLLTGTARGRTVGTASLAGASAALRYIDAAQGRAGGTTAAVAREPRPAAAVPSPPALPTIVAPVPRGVATRPTAAQVARMRRTAGCDLAGFAGSTAPEAHALGGGTTLIAVPCSAGAYNLSYALFTLRGGRVSPAIADVPTGFGEGDAARRPAVVVNGDFDGGLVSGYAKGRGIGDCGIAQSFAWDGARLRLVEQSEMTECRGNTDLITTWRARVVRR